MRISDWSSDVCSSDLQIQSTNIRLDWQGAVLVALFLGSLQFFVELLPKYGAGLPMVVLGVFCGLMFTALIVWEKRCPHPLIPLDMFRKKSLEIGRASCRERVCQYV